VIPGRTAGQNLNVARILGPPGRTRLIECFVERLNKLVNDRRLKLGTAKAGLGAVFGAGIGFYGVISNGGPRNCGGRAGAALPFSIDVDDGFGSCVLHQVKRTDWCRFRWRRGF